MIEKIALVSGGSKGIGLACCLQLAEQGYTVYSLSRSAPPDRKIRHLAADMTDEMQLQDAFSHLERLDLLVNNAGGGISGPVELTSSHEVREQMDLNFVAAVACIRLALPLLRKNGGKIINISSVAAILPVPYQAFYSASKAAINALTLSLANELRNFNIHVSAVMPGDVKTDFTAARKKSSVSGSVYEQSCTRAVERMEKDEQNGMPPEKVAATVAKIAMKKRPKPLYIVGGQYKLFGLLVKLLPARLINAIEGKLYG